MTETENKDKPGHDGDRLCIDCGNVKVSKIGFAVRASLAVSVHCFLWADVGKCEIFLHVGECETIRKTENLVESCFVKQIANRTLADDNLVSLPTRAVLKNPNCGRS